jgi:1-acyl-sn-glycerol-3-phosphate acyltransferase
MAQASAPLGRTSFEACPGARPLKPESSSKLPDISRPLLSWFTWYSRRHIRRHFHSLRISKGTVPSAMDGTPVVLYTNHASWWDPLVCLVIKSEFFGQRRAFAPIDAEALKRYRMFGKLGFFGVAQNSRRGAMQFLRTSELILHKPNQMLALTPQSRFSDARERPVRFQPGIGHLATRVRRSVFIPMAVEYVFWEEPLPEILVRFGEAVRINWTEASSQDSKHYTALFETKMSAAQDALAAEAQRRDPSDFRIILGGNTGQGAIYDWWRTMRARLHGETFRREHGQK